MRYPGLAMIEVFDEEFWGPCDAIEPMISKLMGSQQETLPPIMFHRAAASEAHFSEAQLDSCPSFYLYKNGALFNKLHGPGAFRVRVLTLALC